MPADRILQLGLDDNFWQMGETGPCGRCSEIYFVRGSGSDPEIEIWNNVFMEFERSADGTLTPLPAPSIDTGMGLERVTAVLQGKDSNYDTDQFMPLLTRLGEIADRRYRGTNDAGDVSMRVVADHIRAMTFLIADGVVPSNEWRGYVLRKIMRRAMRHGKHLGVGEPFLHRLVAVLDRDMGDAYPELRTNRETIERTILAEEKRFDAVLTEGLPRLEAEIGKALESPDRVLSGDAAFRLYDTFGLPYDFIEDTAATQDVLDRPGRIRAGDGGSARARRVRRAPSKARRRATSSRWPPTRRSLRASAINSRGTRSTRLTGVPIVGLFDAQRQPADTLAGRSPRIRRAGEDALLPRGRRSGLGRRPDLQ